MAVSSQENLAAEVKNLILTISQKTKIDPHSDIKILIDKMVRADLISESDIKRLNVNHRRTPL